MKSQLRFVLIVVLVALSATAGTDTERVAKLVEQVANDNSAKGANNALSLMLECGAKAVSAKHFIERRAYEMFLHDLEDAVAKMTAAEAQKIFADALPRMTPIEAQISLCFGLKNGPVNPALDEAALKLLVPKADFRLKVALMDLLAAHHHAPAVDKVISMLLPDEFPSVQIAACRALAELRDKKGIPALIKYLEAFKAKGNSRYIYEATGALRFLTGAKFNADAPSWLQWWAANEKDFMIDANAPGKPKFNYELEDNSSDMSYYEIPVVENRLVFILDISGSMAFGGSPNRMTSAKSELKKIIERLNDKQSFNVVAFANNPTRWQKKTPLVPANDANKKEALRFVDSFQPKGGTNTTETMEDVLREVASVTGCESVFLVTDGNPNPWANGITSAMQERHITWINQPLKVRINTIGIYTTTAQEKKGIAKDEDPETMKTFLYSLATNNDGVYREIGKD